MQGDMGRYREIYLHGSSAASGHSASCVPHQSGQPWQKSQPEQSALSGARCSFCMAFSSLGGEQSSTWPESRLAPQVAGQCGSKCAHLGVRVRVRERVRVRVRVQVQVGVGVRVGSRLPPAAAPSTAAASSLACVSTARRERQSAWPLSARGCRLGSRLGLG